MSNLAVSWCKWECRLPVGSLVTCRQFQEDFHTQSGISQHNCVCRGYHVAWSTPCHWAVLALQHTWLVAVQEPWYFLATQGSLRVPHGSLTASWQWQSWVESCPVNTTFHKSSKLSACSLSWSAWVLQAHSSLGWEGCTVALAELCRLEILGKCISPQAVLVKSMSLRRPGW